MTEYGRAKRKQAHRISMTNKRDYLAALRAAITHLHGCGSVHVRTEHVHETFHGETVWQGDVEVFELMHLPKIKRAYAWAHREGPKDEKTRYVVVLELPPVNDAKSAVQASIMAGSQTFQS